MLEQIISRIEVQGPIEELALKMHRPQKNAVYIVLDEDLNYKVLSAQKFSYNSKYVLLDYYSRIININKAVDTKKKIISNNKYTFFCRNINGTTKEMIDSYFKITDPEETSKEFAIWIKENYRKLAEYRGKDEILKVFYLKDINDCVNCGREYFLKNSISKLKKSDKYGNSIFINANQKKPYTVGKTRPAKYLWDDNEIMAFKKKCLYDILYSLYVIDKKIVYILEDGRIYPLTELERVQIKMKNAIFIHTNINGRKQLVIDEYDIVSFYSPRL